MSKKWLILLISLVAFVLIIAIRILFPFDISHIRVAAEPIPGLAIHFSGFELPITNSLLATWLAMLLLVLFALWVRTGIQTVPTRRQNLAEWLIEAIYGLVVGVAGEKWARAFFPIIATIFLFVLISNLMDPFTPILSAITIKGIVHEQEEIVPILRSPSTDLNFTVALALVSVTLTQYFGLRANGVLGYLGKYFNISGFIKFIRLLLSRQTKKAFGALFMGIIDFFIGLIEIVSEMAKVISFSFRLFGNIFAGEVLLIVIPFLLSFLIPLPFLALEVFVSVIQAFVFALLTLAFMKMATLTHGQDSH